MRKFIITLLLITFQTAPTFAAEYSNAEYCSDQASNHEGGAQAGCGAAAGCYWNALTSKCVPCNAGTYKEAGNTACQSCGTTGTKVKWDDQTGTRSQADCKYTATCLAAQYFGGYSTGCVACSSRNNALTGTYKYSTQTSAVTYSGSVGTSASNESSVCTTCGTNSTTNTDGLGCTCNTGYHINGKTNNDINNNSENCVINTYTITYDPNGGDGNKKTQSITHGKTVTLKDASTFTKTGYNLSSWQRKNTSTTYTPGETISDGFTSDITLLANWSGKEFTITYDANGAAVTCKPDQHTCTYGTTNCTASDIPSGCTYAGYVFENWTYNGKSISPGTNITNESNGDNITLTAQWTQCPKGYYCASIIKSDTNPSACPAGSTSAAGSNTKTACYMTGGTTKICDSKNNCFTLPGNNDNKIFYHNGQ